MSDKASKDDVRYSKGHPDSRCGICRYYGDHTCSLVEGRIEPSMWCELFKRKTGNAAER